jgi:GNAT superfamily N-acetyltransferase
VTDLRVAPIPRSTLPDLMGEVARLRIEVFRDWPYLYDGDLAYEEAYLRPYLDSGDAIVVGAWDDNQLVGASTGAPMENHADEFAAPFAAQGIDLSTIFYCAESVLLPAYRGWGVGGRFFDEREAQAHRLSRTFICFCAVIRPTDHPSRPDGYAPLDGFWRSRGYAPMDGVTASFAWRDIGEPTETSKSMQFWGKTL